VWQYTSEGNGSADKRVQFFVTANGKLQVARRDTLHFQILGGVPCQLKDFGSQVLENSSEVNGCFGADARFLASDGSQVALYATARKLFVV
jgi:hypothetical protein